MGNRYTAALVRLRLPKGCTEEELAAMGWPAEASNEVARLVSTPSMNPAQNRATVSHDYVPNR